MNFWGFTFIWLECYIQHFRKRSVTRLEMNCTIFGYLRFDPVTPLLFKSHEMTSSLRLKAASLLFDDERQDQTKYFVAYEYYQCRILLVTRKVFYDLEKTLWD